MYKAIKYINANIAEKITLDEIAGICGYSKWHFCNLFRRFTGMSFTEYVSNQKMQLAAIDILDGDKVIEVATRYGYDSPGGFNKAFLSHFGCFPREFRKNSEEANVRYKERRDKMFKMSDRCKILRDDAVNIKSKNDEISYVHDILGPIGTPPNDSGESAEYKIACKLESIILKSRPYIQEGELIVGYNFADNSSKWDLNGIWFPIENTEECRGKMIAQGISAEDVDFFFKYRERVKWVRSELPEYTPCEKNMMEEGAVVGDCIFSDHNVLDYKSVLELGFEGLLRKVEKYEEINGENELYRAAKKICRAAMKLGEKFADEIAKMRLDQSLTAERANELEKMENACRQVPAKPARNLHEAVQSLWFAHILTTWEDGNVNANSLGRLDQIFYPYYKNDIENGTITKEEAFELISCLWIKLYRDYDVQQSVVGGCDSDGNCAVNELSYMMLDVTEQMDFIRCLSVRYGENSPKDFVRRALEVVGHLQKGVPFFFNDDVMIPSLVSAGIDIKDARDYTQLGCVETVIPGKSNPHAVSGRPNLLKAVEYALNDGKSMISDTLIEGVNQPKSTELDSYEKLRDVVFAHIKNILKITCEKIVLQTEICKIRKKPYKSLLTEGCIERAKDFNSYGAVYDYYQVMLFSVPNIADSLAAMKKLVYDEKKYTLDEIVYQLKNDYPDELIRLDFLNNAPKFGNDIDEVDSIAAEVIDFCCNCLEEFSEKLGRSFHAQPFSYLWLIEKGLNTGATPDGRHKGENVAYSVSPMQGRDFNGVTAVFNSICKLPTKRTPGTTSAIVEVDPKLFTDKNMDSFADMMMVFAKRGLSNVQFNVVDAETLKEAQKSPEKYQNLSVRVSGFSQKFHLLDKELQDHIIERTKHKCF